MSQAIPRTIPEYLDQLRSALRGADPAMIQDALYDAEEHLRAELAEHPGLDEAAMLEKVATSYGAPDEVAEIYRVKEGEVEQALRPRRRQPVAEKSALARFFGVAVDPRAYLALFYMVLTLATGIFYFTWVVTGLSMSAGFAILIIGIPFIILFFATVRALSFVEGKIVEAMLGVRMPRRPQAMQREWFDLAAHRRDVHRPEDLEHAVLHAADDAARRPLLLHRHDRLSRSRSALTWRRSCTCSVRTAAASSWSMATT